jgi:DNA-binding CsgD family transcriptional regulator
MENGEYYNELLRPHGMRWFAAVGFWAGSDLWALTLHRSAREGRFDEAEQLLLARLSDALTDAATISSTFGFRLLVGALDTLDLSGTATVALDRAGRSLHANAAAQAIFDGDIALRQGELLFRDDHARTQMDAVTGWLRSGSGATGLPCRGFVARRSGKDPVIVRVLPVPSGVYDALIGARALIALSKLRQPQTIDAGLLADAFDLSRSEAKLAALIGSGLTVSQAAEALGVVHSTVRNQLKSVFAKTATHRQADLVALFAAFSEP